MIKGLAITPPVLGRISIGRVVERNDKRIPVKDDQFTITTQVRGKDGWLSHPVDEALRSHSANQKLRSIPVSVLFDQADLNLRADYSLFDRQTGRLMCVGNGEVCRRHTPEGVKTLDCPSPTHCELAQGGLACKLYGRLHVRVDAREEARVDGSQQAGNVSHDAQAPDAAPSASASPDPTLSLGDDDIGSFVFRTTGYNSVRTLAARLQYYQAVSGGKLASMPLELKLRAKSTTMSRGTPIYYADLAVREGLSLQAAVAQAQSIHQARAAAGFDQSALDQAAQLGYANGGFEESDEDGLDVVEEFYPSQAADAQISDGQVQGEALQQPRPRVQGLQASLKQKLTQKAQPKQESAFHPTSSH